MVKAIRIFETGGPEVMEPAELSLGEPGPDEIRIRQEAVGINFLDVYQRDGLYPMPLPFVPGNEGAGIVTEIGAEVTEVRLGDRICYAGATGAYAAERLLPARLALPVPEGISSETAAAVTLKGLTAYYLLEETFGVDAGHTILFHAAAGGVGQLAVQWAKAKGARVIATAGSPEKVKIAEDLGCDLVLDIRADPDFAPKVRAFTQGQGVDVVYDSIGKDTFVASLDCLRPRGLMVSFGNSSGPVSVESLGILSTKGSLYVTRPTMAHYYPDRDSKVAAMTAIFEKIRSGDLKVSIGQTFPLDDAADAHRALESRQTTGSTLLIP